MLAMLGAAVVAFSVYLYLASPSRVAKVAGDLLANLTGADVRIQSAHFALDGVMTLRGLEMRIRHVQGQEGLLFDAERVRIRHDLLSLLRGVFQARTLTFIKPTMHLTEVAGTGRYNFQLLQQQRVDNPEADLPRHLPEIFLRDGRVLMGELRGKRFHALSEVHVSGNLNPSRDEGEAYLFVVRQEYREGIEGPAGPILSGKIDLRRLAVAAKIEHFRLDTPHRTMLPRQLRAWWDQLEPMGSLPSVRFGYDWEAGAGFTAELELAGGAITLPYGELASRMTDVSGRFTIANQVVTVTNLTGQIEDLRYVINGRVDGFSRDAPFRLSVQTDPFAIPEEPRYLLALPTAVQKQFRRFTPSGTFQAQAVVERSARGGHLFYDGVVDISDTKMVYHQFRYPLEGVRGKLRFNDERIELVALRGRGPTGASVTIDGVIAPPMDGAAAHVVVTATDSPIDHVLYEAVPEKLRPVLDLFFNGQAHERLISLGLVQTKVQQRQRREQLDQLHVQRQQLEAADLPDVAAIARLDSSIAQLRDQVQRPVFDLGGRGTVIAQSARAFGADQKARLTIGLKAAGIQALFAHWPYPLRGTAGQLLIKPGEVVVDGIEVQGITGGSGKISGTIQLPVGGSGQLIPQLDLVIHRIPADPILYASIPSPRDRWLGDLHLEGVLAGTGRIDKDEQGQMDYQIHAQLSEGSLQPYGGRFRVENLTGHGTLRLDGLQIDSLEGTSGQARIALSGGTRRVGGQPRLDIGVKVTDLDLDPSLLDLLPPHDPNTERVRAFFDEVQPAGRLDAQLSYGVEGDHSADYRFELRFGRLSFDRYGTRIDLQQIQGGLVVTPTAIELDEWGGTFGTGQFVTNGVVGIGPAAQVNLAFDAQAQQLCPTTRAFLPEVVLSVVDGLELDGAYNIQNATLFYEAGNGNPVFRFHGKARLSDAKATVGVPITQMAGDLEIDASRQTGASWPKLDLRINAQRLLAARRLTSPLSLRIASADRPDVLRIRGLHGSCYGGTLLGSGQIDLGDSGRYRMNLVLQDVALDPFLHPDQYPHETGPTDQTKLSGSGDVFTGVLAASLSIEGSAGEPSRRRGRGDLEIRDANLYEVPLSLALIQILNLSLPASRSFDRAAASYLIDDDLVLIDAVRFEAPTIEIVGTGSMRYSTLDLDLNLFTRNPGSPRFGLLSDLLGVFKDELLSIRVTGTLDDPKPSATSFQGIRRSWEEIFGRPKSLVQRPLLGRPGTDTMSGQ